MIELEQWQGNEQLPEVKILRLYSNNFLYTRPGLYFMVPNNDQKWGLFFFGLAATYHHLVVGAA